MELSLSHFNFDLPGHLIAQEPCPQRDQSRLLVLERKTGRREHHLFNRLPEYLSPGDVLVINDTQVIPARLSGKNQTGGQVECLILNYPSGQTKGPLTTSCLIKAGRKMRPGERVTFGSGLEGEVLPSGTNGTGLMRFFYEGTFDSVLRINGSVPLPPYIRRKGRPFVPTEEDEVRYQTVYARHPGAVAAPTAGLHFSEGLIETIRKKGVTLVPLTLHVGYGTFAPIKTESIKDHKIHSEPFHLSPSSAEMIMEKKRLGGRVMAVGTTTVRVLEYVARKYGSLEPSEGECDLFITPGFSFRVIDGMITNFHLPKTTLLLLVSAFAGREMILDAYREARDLQYRFYSYGDAMLIL